MKKTFKIIFLTAFMLLNVSFLSAQENTPLTIETLDKMPTDEEIMETINKFNFDEKKKEYLFNETKKSLEKMYLESQKEVKSK